MMHHSSFIDFGKPIVSKEFEDLEQRLEVEIQELALNLPEPLRAGASSLLKRLHRGRRSFISLFYLPTWSFLIEVPIKQLSKETFPLALRAHAMSLFLHYWDDHLVDGQLRTTHLSLQIRTLAWERFIESVHELAGIAHKTTVQDYVGRYFYGIYKERHIENIEAYCKQTELQAATWTLTPLLLAHLKGSPYPSDEVPRFINAFCKAWRMVDDIQDVKADLFDKTKTGVYFSFPSQQSALWDEVAKGKAVEPSIWKDALHQAIFATIERTNHFLSQAIESAKKLAWDKTITVLMSMSIPLKHEWVDQVCQSYSTEALRKRL